MEINKMAEFFEILQMKIKVKTKKIRSKKWRGMEIPKATLRKRIAKGKLFRQSCDGCISKEEYDTHKIMMCKLPYKAMPFCPCRNCLVKVSCVNYCDRYKQTREKYDIKHKNFIRGIKIKK